MINETLNLPDLAQHIVFPVIRWLHIVCTTALVGGTLFYEFVIPKAIEDLKDEAQLAVLGRVRWIFREIVVWSALILIVTGIVSTWRTWHLYSSPFEQARPWWALHVGLGVIAMAVAVRMTISDNVPRHPIRWLRINLVILLIVIFLASATRYLRLTIREQMDRNFVTPSMPGETR
jgi:hypothetical protein